MSAKTPEGFAEIHGDFEPYWYSMRKIDFNELLLAWLDHLAQCGIEVNRCTSNTCKAFDCMIVTRIDGQPFRTLEDVMSLAQGWPTPEGYYGPTIVFHTERDAEATLLDEAAHLHSRRRTEAQERKEAEQRADAIARKGRVLR